MKKLLSLVAVIAITFSVAGFLPQKVHSKDGVSSSDQQVQEAAYGHQETGSGDGGISADNNARDGQQGNWLTYFAIFSLGFIASQTILFVWRRYSNGKGFPSLKDLSIKALLYILMVFCIPLIWLYNLIREWIPKLNPKKAPGGITTAGVAKVVGVALLLVALVWSALTFPEATPDESNPQAAQIESPDATVAEKKEVESLEEEISPDNNDTITPEPVHINVLTYRYKHEGEIKKKDFDCMGDGNINKNTLRDSDLNIYLDQGVKPEELLEELNSICKEIVRQIKEINS